MDGPSVVQLLITVPACTVLAEEKGLKVSGGFDGLAVSVGLLPVCGFAWESLPAISNPLSLTIRLII